MLVPSPGQGGDTSQSLGEGLSWIPEKRGEIAMIPRLYGTEGSKVEYPIR